MKSFDRGDKKFVKKDFGGRGDNRNFRDKQMFKAICSNCGKECEVPFKPTGDRPVFCSDCFKKRSNLSRAENNNFKPQQSGGGSHDQVSKQHDMINSKLDRIISLLTTLTAQPNAKPAKTVKAVKAPAKKKPTAKKKK